jgi:hypothetical protein
MGQKISEEEAKKIATSLVPRRLPKNPLMIGFFNESNEICYSYNLRDEMLTDNHAEPVEDSVLCVALVSRINDFSLEVEKSEERQQAKTESLKNLSLKRDDNMAGRKEPEKQDSEHIKVDVSFETTKGPKDKGLEEKVAEDPFKFIAELEDELKQDGLHAATLTGLAFLRDYVTKLEKYNTGKETELKNLNKELKSYTKKYNDELKNRADLLQTKEEEIKAKYDSQIGTLQKEIDDVRITSAEERKKLEDSNQSRIEELKSKYEKERKDLEEDYTNHVKEVTDKYGDAIKEVGIKSMEIGELNTTLVTTQSECTNLEERLQQKEDEFVKYKEEVQGTDAGKAAEQIKGYESKIALFEDKNKNQATSIENLEKELHQRNKTIELREEELKQANRLLTVKYVSHWAIDRVEFEGYRFVPVLNPSELVTGYLVNVDGQQAKARIGLFDINTGCYRKGCSDEVAQRIVDVYAGQRRIFREKLTKAAIAATPQPEQERQRDLLDVQ